MDSLGFLLHSKMNVMKLKSRGAEEWASHNMVV